MLKIIMGDKKMLNYDIKGAIFDVDGTILDSMKVWSQATGNFYTEHNLVLTKEEIQLFQSMTLQESLPYIVKTYKLDMTVNDVENELKQFISHAYKNDIPAKPHCTQFIKTLHQHGVRIAIATSGYPEFCKAAFERLGISEYISAYALSSEVGVNKSNPDVYLLAASRIGIAPDKCMVFEDISAGIIGAKKGGFLTCAVYDDSNKAETGELKKEADIYIRSWKELF